MLGFLGPNGAGKTTTRDDKIVDLLGVSSTLGQSKDEQQKNEC